MHFRRCFIVVTTLAVLLASGCSLTRAASKLGRRAFTPAQMGDMDKTGKSGAVVPFTATALKSADPAMDAELADSMKDEAAGVLLPVTEVGETKPWWVVCFAGEQEKLCRSIPLNATVTFSGVPMNKKTLILPSRLTWSGQ